MRMSTIATSGGSVATSREEVLGGARLADDFDALLGQEPREAFADDDGVVGEDHAHGIVRRDSCSSGRGALDHQVTVERLDAVAQPAEPGSRRRRLHRRRRR